MALLEVTDLALSFGGLQALTAFSLQLAPGDFVGLIGPNGAGKTTVFNLITGVYRPERGRIVFAGQDITTWPSHRRLAAGMGRTFQNIRLFRELTVLDNVRIGAFARYSYSFWGALWRSRSFRRQEEELAREALELLERFGLRRYARTLARQLPYGEQRRLEIARALISHPRLLLLDEPAAGMNQAETAALIELLRQLWQEYDLTILLIEHHMGVVQELCHRVVVLDFGETIFSGPPAAAQRHPRVREAYLGKEGDDGRPFA